MKEVEKIQEESHMSTNLFEEKQKTNDENEEFIRNSMLLFKNCDTNAFSSLNLKKNEKYERKKIRNSSRISGKNESCTRKIMSETKRLLTGWPQKTNQKNYEKANIENIPMKITKLSSRQ